MDEMGYIVFEGSGTCPLNDGAYERWFKTYEEAIEAAVESVKQDALECRRENGWHADVLVYKAPESLMHKTHTYKNDDVVFRWKNF